MLSPHVEALQPEDLDPDSDDHHDDSEEEHNAHQSPGHAGTSSSSTGAGAAQPEKLQWGWSHRLPEALVAEMQVLLDRYQEGLVPLELRKDLEARYTWPMTSINNWFTDKRKKIKKKREKASGVASSVGRPRGRPPTLPMPVSAAASGGTRLPIGSGGGSINSAGAVPQMPPLGMWNRQIPPAVAPVPKDKRVLSAADAAIEELVVCKDFFATHSARAHLEMLHGLYSVTPNPEEVDIQRWTPLLDALQPSGIRKWLLWRQGIETTYRYVADAAPAPVSSSAGASGSGFATTSTRQTTFNNPYLHMNPPNAANPSSTAASASTTMRHSAQLRGAGAVGEEIDELKPIVTPAPAPTPIQTQTRPQVQTRLQDQKRPLTPVSTTTSPDMRSPRASGSGSATSAPAPQPPPASGLGLELRPVQEPLSPASVAASEDTLSGASGGEEPDGAQPSTSTSISRQGPQRREPERWLPSSLFVESGQSQQRVASAPALVQSPSQASGLRIEPGPFTQLRASALAQDAIPNKRGGEWIDGSRLPPSLRQFVRERYPGGREDFRLASEAKLAAIPQSSTSGSGGAGSPSGVQEDSRRQIAEIGRQAEEALILLRQLTGK